MKPLTEPFLKVNENPILIIKTIANIAETKFNEILKPTGLTSTQLQTLKILLENGKPLLQSELQEILKIKHSTMCGILKRIEEKGFIKVETNDEDRRQKIIIVTDKAKEVNDQVTSKAKEFVSSILKGVSEEEMLIYFKTINKIYQNLTK